MDKHDVIIIGGGIVGLCIAYELARYDLDIILLEKEAEVCFGVSKSNSGIIHTGFQSSPDTLKARLAVRGNSLYRILAERLSFPLRNVGELIVAFDGQENALQELQAHAEALGISDTRLVGPDWLREQEPLLSPDITAALLGGTACVVNPYEAAYAIAENTEANGVAIRTEEKVLAIRSGGNCWEVLTSKAATYTSAYVINAAGLYADDISQMAGISCERVTPRKGEEYLLDKHAGQLTGRIIFPLPSEKSKGILVIPTIDHNYMIGPTAYEVTDKTDLATSGEGKTEVLEHARTLVPTIDENLIIASFAGLRPATKSGDFHIREDKPGFINLIGIQSPGLTAAPAIGEYVTEMVGRRLPLRRKERYIEQRTPIPRFRELPAEQKNALILQDPDYGQIICRCETVTRGEIKEAIRRGARTLDGIKFRTRCQMGRCHGSFCTMKIMSILYEELGYDYNRITKRGGSSRIIAAEDT